jgi:hypothetical protein
VVNVTVVVQVINESHRSASTVEQVVAAAQAHIDRDVGPVWHVTAVVTTSSVTGALTIRLRDRRTAGPHRGWVGWHDEHGGLVDARPADWAETLMHEVDEMIVDPPGTPCLAGMAPEIADPVSGVTVMDGRVRVPDIVTPAWFTGGPGPYDLAGAITRPGQVVRGGTRPPICP